MAEGKRAKYRKEFKFKIALEAIKGEKQINVIAAEYKIHPEADEHSITSWWNGSGGR